MDRRRIKPEPIDLDHPDFWAVTDEFEEKACPKRLIAQRPHDRRNLMGDKPNFEGFAREILNQWPGNDIDGFEVFELAIKHRMIEEIPGGFDPEKHEDYHGISPARGDPWYRYAFNTLEE